MTVIWIKSVRYRIIGPLTVAALAALVALSGCSRAVVARDTLAALDAAAVGFRAWDESHQERLVAEHEDDPATARKLVDAYRARREAVLAAFAVAYTAVGVATASGPGEALRALGELLAAVRLLQAEMTTQTTQTPGKVAGEEKTP